MFKLHLTQRYIPALILIASFVVTSNYLSTEMISSNNEYAKIINISGKQRMLSQRLIVLTINYKEDQTINNKKQLLNTLNAMEKAHKYLLTKQFTPMIKTIYQKNGLNNNLNNYLAYFYKVINKDDFSNMENARNDAKSILLQLDKIVKEYEKYANEQLILLKQYEFYLMLSTLFILLFSAFFIFLPASKQILRQTAKIVEKEEYEETIIESNNNAIIAIDWTGKITTYNDKAQELFGWTKEEMIGSRNLLNIIPPKYRDLHINASKSYLSSGKSCGVIGNSHELEGIRKNGEIFPIHISFGAKYKIKGSIVVANIEDITYKKEQELLLIQQSKMASMGEMIGNIAHQWRQPLSAITTHASGSILHKEMGILTDEHLIKSYKDIIKSANFLSDTINDFRDFFQESKDKKPFLIVKEIGHIKGITKNNYDTNNIGIYQNELDEDITCIGIKNEFGQVIMNILNNAKDILIEKGIEKKVVYIETIQVNNNCTIKIYDNAGGIAKEIISKVFDPYFTTKHQRQGTGIGLHMSSEIIVKHFNGTLSATNEYFKIKDKRHYGACFCINIPLS